MSFPCSHRAPRLPSRDCGYCGACCWLQFGATGWLKKSRWVRFSRCVSRSQMTLSASIPTHWDFVTWFDDRWIVAPFDGASNVNPGRRDMSQENPPQRVKVFVLLGYDFGANSWARRYAEGLIPGLNDCFAYGYYRASGDGWSVEYSQDRDEGRLTRLGRLALRKLLGFDLIHVCRNRRGIFEADVVWTHTEIEHLG